MGLDNPLHIAFLLILLLLVFGAKRLPEMGRSLGSGMRGFKETLSGEHTHTALPTGQEPAPASVAPAAPVRETGAPVAYSRHTGQDEIMAVAAARIGHEDRLSIVDHLSELRGRLIVSLAALAVAFGFCMWQNHALLHIINKPLAAQTQKQVKAGRGPLGATYTVQQGARSVATQLQAVAGALERPGSGVSRATRATLAGVAPKLQRAIEQLSKAPQGEKPVTLGIGEPFTTTITIAMIFALILALPVILFQLYGFLLPAFSPKGQQVARSLTLAIPLLFVAGVLFGYFVVLPAAVRFFQNFNSGEFNVLVQASQYYHFAAVTLLAMGLVFQIPVAILAVTRAEIVTTAQLRHNRRYAVLACGAVAAFLPGDAVTLLLETVPLYLLFEASLLLARFAERRARSRGESAADRASR